MPPPGGGKGDFPFIGEPAKKSSGLYMVIESKVSGENLEKMSPIIIEKTIKANIGDVQSIKKTKDGKILVLTKNEKQAQLVTKLTKMGTVEVVGSEHRSLNTCRVVISNRDLLYEEDGEIEKVLKNQGVVKVERIMRKRGQELQKTAAFILTVRSSSPPEKVKIGYLSIQTRPYYPRPLRCYNCLQFGHIGKICKTEKLCRRCGNAYHGEECNQEEKCVNCNEQHSALSNKCEKYVQEVKITKLKIDKNVSYWEAKQLIDAEKKSSYADEAKKSLEEEYINAALKREEEFKQIIDEYENRVKILDDAVKRLNDNLTKAVKRIADEKMARKRAEKEYDDLSAWISKQRESTPPGSRSNNKTISPIRKKPCKQIDDEPMIQESGESGDENR